MLEEKYFWKEGNGEDYSLRIYSSLPLLDVYIPSKVPILRHEAIRKVLSFPGTVVTGTRIEKEEKKDNTSSFQFISEDGTVSLHTQAHFTSSKLDGEYRLQVRVISPEGEERYYFFLQMYKGEAEGIYYLLYLEPKSGRNYISFGYYDNSVIQGAERTYSLPESLNFSIDPDQLYLEVSENESKYQRDYFKYFKGNIEYLNLKPFLVYLLAPEVQPGFTYIREVYPTQKSFSKGYLKDEYWDLFSTITDFSLTRSPEEELSLLTNQLGILRTNLEEDGYFPYYLEVFLYSNQIKVVGVSYPLRKKGKDYFGPKYIYDPKLARRVSYSNPL